MPLSTQVDEAAFQAGGCGALAGAFRNYDMLSTTQRQQLLQARFPRMPIPLWDLTLWSVQHCHANGERHVHPQQRCTHS